MQSLSNKLQLQSNAFDAIFFSIHYYIQLNLIQPCIAVCVQQCYVQCIFINKSSWSRDEEKSRFKFLIKKLLQIFQPVCVCLKNLVVAFEIFQRKEKKNNNNTRVLSCLMCVFLSAALFKMCMEFHAYIGYMFIKYIVILNFCWIFKSYETTCWRTLFWCCCTGRLLLFWWVFYVCNWVNGWGQQQHLNLLTWLIIIFFYQSYGKPLFFRPSFIFRHTTCFRIAKWWIFSRWGYDSISLLKQRRDGLSYPFSLSLSRIMCFHRTHTKVNTSTCKRIETEWKTTIATDEKTFAALALCVHVFKLVKFSEKMQFNGIAVVRLGY